MEREREYGLPYLVEDTLAWCNEQRAKRGLGPLASLPKGEKHDPESCPCGRATGLYVDNDTFASSKSQYEEGSRQYLPVTVVAFVSAFDDGQFPQYEESLPDESDWNELDES